jgi:hypothetical protein
MPPFLRTIFFALSNLSKPSNSFKASILFSGTAVLYFKYFTNLLNSFLSEDVI